jgi:phenylacetic acid degradation operon negative regulatory protein
MYATFGFRFEPVLDRWTRGSVPDEKQAFIDYIAVIADWRKLPFLDPGLPPEVLPTDWAGDRAKWIHLSLLERLDRPAFDYVKAACRGADYMLG